MAVNLEDTRIERVKCESEAAMLEAYHGANALTDYLRRFGKRPPPKMAETIGKLQGWRVKADDGKFYPKLTKGQQAQRRAIRERRKSFAKRLDDALAISWGVQYLAGVGTPAADLLDIAEGEWSKVLAGLAAARRTLAAIEAALRQGAPGNDNDRAPHDRG